MTAHPTDPRRILMVRGGDHRWVRHDRALLRALQLGGLIPSVLGAAGAVAAAALWIPSQYKDLRFEDVGLENFTDPAITGGTLVPR